MTSNDDKEKEVSYNAAIVNAWLTTRLEHDKSILTLSAGGIGLLVTLLTAVGAQSTTIFILFIFATVAFLIAVISVVVILNRNSTHLEKVAKSEEKSDPILHLLDNVASYSFIVGVLFTLSIGLSIGVNSLRSNLEAKMSEKQSQKTMIKRGKKSYNGISKLRPNEKQESDNSQGGQSSSEQSQQSNNQNTDKK